MGETSSTLQVLLDGVKPIWDGAQGDRGGLGVDRERTSIDWVCVNTMQVVLYLSGLNLTYFNVEVPEAKKLCQSLSKVE